MSLLFKGRALEKTLGNNYLRKTLRCSAEKGLFYKMSTFSGEARLQEHLCSHVCGQKGYYPCCYNNHKHNELYVIYALHCDVA